jgi:hypothetical protein
MVAARSSESTVPEQPWPDTAVTQVSRAHFDAWDLSAVRERYGPTKIQADDEFRVVGGDVVSSAPELVRLTQNIAKVHHDATASGSRLVYGGHSVGIALHQLARTLPGLVTVPSWESCDHTGPVHEGDTLHSRVLIKDTRTAEGRTYAAIQVLVRATRADGTVTDVLDWHLTALLP